MGTTIQGRNGAGALTVNGKNAVQVVVDLMDVEAILICDTSSSMDDHDAGKEHNQRRFDVMAAAVAELRRAMHERLAVVAFNDSHELVAGDLSEPDGCTNMVGVLEFVQPISGMLRKIVLLSDGEPTAGEPDPETATLRAARKIQCPLDVVYCGPAGSRAENFLRSLAQAGKGSYERVALLTAHGMAESIQTKLLTGAH
jgi:hypothetical protein